MEPQNRKKQSTNSGIQTSQSMGETRQISRGKEAFPSENRKGQKLRETWFLDPLPDLSLFLATLPQACPSSWCDLLTIPLTKSFP